MVTLPKNIQATPALPGGHGNGSVHFLHFSELLKRPVCAGSIRDRIGKLTDLVFAPMEPFPEAAGIFLDHGWGKPTEFVPWDKVIKIEDDAIFVQPAPGGAYPPFVDQPGWILVDRHLMGRTILDIDGRRIEVVNDVRFIESHSRLLLADVDLSFNGFLRRWGLGRMTKAGDKLVSWKYVQPLSLEDAIPTDRLKLSVTRSQLQDLPGEDLADALEELSGTEQQALFSALDPEKAAETLTEAEPRAQRQIIEDLTSDQGRAIFDKMTVLQLANLFASLPQEKMREVSNWLGPVRAKAVTNLLTEREATAKDMISSSFVAKPASASVGDVLKEIRRSHHEPRTLSYLYVVADEAPVLLGVIDLRDLVLADDDLLLSEIMASPVVAAQESDLRDDLEKMFEKYGFGMIPVVDDQDRLYGVIRYNDIMKGPELNT
jgi:CBS domain-containing protein/sporulation protein YlmC with PRC-barrel domain